MTTKSKQIEFKNVLFKDIPEPSNPSDGQGWLYKKSSDDGLWWRPDSGGAPVDLTVGPAVSLDIAYNGGAAITVDADPITLTRASGSTDVLQLVNAGTGAGLYIDHNGNGNAINIDSEATSSSVVNIETVVTSGIGLYLHNSGIQTGNALLYVHQDHASSIASGILVNNDGSGYGIELDCEWTLTGNGQIKLIGAMTPSSLQTGALWRNVNNKLSYRNNGYTMIMGEHPVIEVNAATYSISSESSGSCISVVYSAALCLLTLPSARAGLVYYLCENTTQQLRFRANTGDVIWWNGASRATPNGMYMSLRGRLAILTAVDATNWFITVADGGDIGYF